MRNTSQKSTESSTFQDPLSDENMPNNWVNPNRKTLFKSLKRGTSSSCANSSSGRNSRFSSSKQSLCKNDESCSIKSSVAESKVSAASEDLFIRSVSSLEQRTHRTDLHSNHIQFEDIPFECNPKPVDNYKPPSERISESVDKRKKFCQNFVDIKKNKENEECTFNPKLISKQTTIEHHDHNAKNKIPQNPAVPKVVSVINSKSKEIAEELTQDRSIYHRQSTKLYRRKDPIQPEKKIKSKEEIDQMIMRLTTPAFSQTEEEDDDETENEDLTTKRKISTKTIKRLVDNSVQRYQTRVHFVEDNSYKPKINPKSLEIANNLTTEHVRDLFKESLTENVNREKEAALKQQFREAQDMAECKCIPKKRSMPSYLKMVQEIQFADLRENNPNRISSNESAARNTEIETKPFSFNA